MTKNKKAKAATTAATTTAGNGAPQRRKQGSLLSQSWPFMALLAGLLVLALAATFFLVRNSEQAHKAELSALYRQQYLAIIDNYIRNHEAETKAYPDAELLPYLQGDGTALLSRFPGALHARVVSVNIDPAVPNGLSFANQDMVLRLAAGERVTPEISFYETENVKEQAVTFARVLKDEAGAPTAVLLLSFPFEPLAKALKGLAPQVGALELAQKVGKESASILKVGEIDASADTAVRTSNPGWEFHFAPSASLGMEHSPSPALLGLMAGLPLLGAGVFVWGIFSLQRKIKEDLGAIDTFADNFFHYGSRQRPALHFEFSGVLLEHLDRYGAELRAGRSAVRPPATDELGDIGVLDGDSSSLLGDAPAPKAVKSPAQTAAKKHPSQEKTMDGLKSEIFRAYDVRGIVGQGLTQEVARALGQAIGSEAIARGDSTVVVGRDGRLSGPELSAALVEGLRASGCDVIDVGVVPTPVLYFAAKTRGSGSGVMVTGSHNPPNYNGFKIMLAGDTLAGDEIQALRVRIEKNDFASGKGGLSQINIAQEYIDRVAADIALARPLRIVVDGGNGVAGPIGMRALEATGCEVVPLFCEIDGNFPNHHPDPSKPQNLEDLIGVVASNGADLGIAFDGDGDRIGVVTATGKIIYPDRLMMLYAKHVLTTNPGADIIFDVKCTRDLPNLISSLGGRPVMCKTGHSFIKGKLKETGAALAGEMSGHVFFNDRWFGFDDAIYSAARLLEIMSLESGDSDQVFAEFPENPSTPEINIPVPDESKFDLMDALRTNANFPDANVITLDGVRVEFDEGWGLVRASNTTPCLVARFEGKTPAALAAVQAKFKALLNNVDANLQIPF